jgi:hypothetical protein
MVTVKEAREASAYLENATVEQIEEALARYAENYDIEKGASGKGKGPEKNWDARISLKGIL